MTKTGQRATEPSCRWRTAKYNTEQADKLVRALNIDITLAHCLLTRGIETVEDADDFLSPKLSQCVMPDKMPGVTAATEAICSHIARKNKIVVFGDFDADGMTAASILALAIQAVGGSADIFIPDRISEGYGFTTNALSRCLELHPATKIIVTVDCGISQSDACKEAVSRDVDVVITDHHKITGPLPAEASAIVNPELEGTPANLRHLCGAGVAFKLAHQIARRAELDKEKFRALANCLLPLAAIGTVADLVPLIGENRIIVSKGLSIINNPNRDTNIGINELKRTAKVNNATSENIGFALAARINAAGRVGNPDTAVTLLNTKCERNAVRLAQQLEKDNTNRQKEELDAVEEAQSKAASLLAKRPGSIVIFNSNWHPGVIGLVASRLVSRHRVPTVVITNGEDGFCRGSARCPEHENLDLMPLLASCSHLLARHGGHRVAAGLTIAEENICKFCNEFGEVCAKATEGLDLRPELTIDAWIDHSSLNEATAKTLQRLEPCGMKNPSPKLGVCNLTLSKEPSSFGKNRQDNWRLSFKETSLNGILFGKKDLPFEEGDKLDIIFAFSRDLRGNLQMSIRDFASAQT